MELVTREEAAKRAFVTPSMISIWIKRGRIQKHPNPNGRANSYLVDMTEVYRAHRISDWAKVNYNNPNLVTPAQIAEHYRFTVATIYRWVEEFNLTKYPIPTSTRQYLLDYKEFEEKLVRPVI